MFFNTDCHHGLVRPNTMCEAAILKSIAMIIMNFCKIIDGAEFVEVHEANGRFCMDTFVK